MASTFDLLLLGGLAVVLCLVFGRRKRKLPLAGKSIFITGCDSGYGFSLAIHAREQGMRVVAGCYVQEGEGRALLESLGVSVVSLDLTQGESIARAVAGVTELCANSGIPVGWAN